MSFTSFQFVLFFAVVLLAYYLVPKRWQWAVLLAASYVFYAFTGVKMLAFLLFTTVTTFVAGLLLGRRNEAYKKALAEGKGMLTSEDKKRLKADSKAHKKWIVLGALMVNFGLLAFLKYYDFIAENVNSLLAQKESGGLPTFQLLLPLGLSFYIFQSAGYVIDVYRDKYKPDRSLAKFALFVSFFPQIIQGPIGRYDQLAGQLYARRSVNLDHLKYGIQLMLWGCFKKMVVADRAAVVVNQVFGNYLDYGGCIIAAGVIFYCIQIYCDFSGGIDIARGAAGCLGIRMAENFERPYFAISIGDYWRRWHITLGSWMRDYLFYPLSLSKPITRLNKFTRNKLGNHLGKILPTCLVYFIVFFVIGIWHGANWKYIAFGVWNGSLIMLALILAPLFETGLEKCRIDPDGLPWHLVRMLRTFLLVCIGRYFTRADSLHMALSMMKRTVVSPQAGQLLDGTLMTLGLQWQDFLVIFLSVAVLYVVAYYQEKGYVIRSELEKRSFFMQWLVLLLGLLTIVLFGIYREGYIASEFIYAQF